MSKTPLTLESLASAYAAGRTPQEIVAEVYARIAEVGDPGIFIHLRDQQDVLAEAASLKPRGADAPLWGAPFVVKDNIDVAGLPTTAACPGFSYCAEADAVVVAKLRAAGALVIGKTNLDQFATGLVGMRSPYPPPKNAIDPAIVPGGSSSGSAVAVAQGIAAFSLGTDTAGSGRVPAALNNIVGLKPSLGALSATGMVPACRTLDTMSIFALTVSDAYAVFRVAAGYDASDAYSRAIAAPALGPAPAGLVVGAPDAASRRFFGDAAQAASFEAALAALEAQGHRIQPIDFSPFYAVAEMLYEGAWIAERQAAIEPLLSNRPDALHPVTRQLIGAATSLSAADAFRGFYRLQDLKRAVAPALEMVELFCVPTIPTFVSTAEIAADPIGPNARLGVYTNFVNLLDLCGVATPTAPRIDGRPGGATLLAKAGRDALVAGVALGLEQLGDRRLGATGWAVPPAPVLAAAAVSEDEMELAVCGAHMSGLALNGQLRERGGRLLRAVKTQPCYRLYALPGGPPTRPGLVRTSPEQGGAIATEVWALPKSEIGSLLALVPPPLGFGSVLLADGTTPKGFVCESIGVADAEDVTTYGDWRKVPAAGTGGRAAP